MANALWLSESEFFKPRRDGMASTVMLLSVFIQICLPILILVGVGWGLDRRFQLELAMMFYNSGNSSLPLAMLVRWLEIPDWAWILGSLNHLSDALIGVAAALGRLIAKKLITINLTQGGKEARPCNENEASLAVPASPPLRMQSFQDADTKKSVIFLLGEIYKTLIRL